MTAAVRCTASGQVRTVLASEWVASEGVCPDCGARVALMVRGTDLSPRCKVRAHAAPAGVVPGPYRYDPKQGAQVR